MDLPGAQAELIERVAAANPRTVVVLNAGSPIAMPWIDRVRGDPRRVARRPGDGGRPRRAPLRRRDPVGQAADHLSGPARGHPCLPPLPRRRRRGGLRRGRFVGYRSYDTRAIEPRFAFGHGLSYTSFVYGEPRLSAAALAAGAAAHRRGRRDEYRRRPGSEVVQLYVRPLDPRLPRPFQELKAFAKIALAPGSAGPPDSSSTSARSPPGIRAPPPGSSTRVSTTSASAARRGTSGEPRESSAAGPHEASFDVAERAELALAPIVEGSAPGLAASAGGTRLARSRYPVTSAASAVKVRGGARRHGHALAWIGRQVEAASFAGFSIQHALRVPAPTHEEARSVEDFEPGRFGENDLPPRLRSGRPVVDQGRQIQPVSPAPRVGCSRDPEDRRRDVDQRDRLGRSPGRPGSDPASETAAGRASPRRRAGRGTRARARRTPRRGRR